MTKTDLNRLLLCPVEDLCEILKNYNFNLLVILLVHVSLIVSPLGDPPRGNGHQKIVKDFTFPPFLFGVVFFCQLCQGINRLKRGRFMHEVKVYDSSGKLKQVISVKKLNIRSEKQLEFPALFKKNKRTGRPLEKPAKTQVKTKASQL